MNRKYLLDTNICIYIIKQKPQLVINRFNEMEKSQITISSITVAELEYGVKKSSLPDKNQKALTDFLQPFAILTFDRAAAVQYGVIRSDLERKGTSIGSLDNLIAAHAMSLNLTLVTNNEKEFNRVEGLLLENWTN